MSSRARRCAAPVWPGEPAPCPTGRRMDAARCPRPLSGYIGIRRRDLDALSLSLFDGGVRLALVRVVLVAQTHVAERHRYRPVLHLPDVAELMDDQILGRLGDPHEDRPMQGVAVE